MSGHLVELLHADDRVMNVRTGELLNLRDSSPEDLAQAREGLAALRRELDNAAVLLDAEIVARVDTAVRAGEVDKYTVRVGGYEIKVPSPEAGGELDVHALRQDLIERVNAGTLNLESHAVEGAFTAKTVYTLRRSVYHTLAKQEPELEALLKRHTGPPSRRRATVSPLPGMDAPVAVAAAADNVIEDKGSFPW